MKRILIAAVFLALVAGLDRSARAATIGLATGSNVVVNIAKTIAYVSSTASGRDRDQFWSQLWSQDLSLSVLLVPTAWARPLSRTRDFLRFVS